MLLRVSLKKKKQKNAHQFPKCSPQFGTPREAHRVTWKETEKRREGDRGDQEEKTGSQKWKDQSSQ